MPHGTRPWLPSAICHSHEAAKSVPRQTLRRENGVTRAGIDPRNIIISFTLGCEARHRRRRGPVQGLIRRGSAFCPACREKRGPGPVGRFRRVRRRGRDGGAAGRTSPESFPPRCRARSRARRRLPQFQPRPAPAYSPVSASVASDLARWNSLRQSDSLPFSSYASFLTRAIAAGRARRRCAGPPNRPIPTAAPPVEVIGFFSAFPPLTPAGHARHAFALRASAEATRPRGGGAQGLDRRACCRATDEAPAARPVRRPLDAADHDKRMEALLGNGDTPERAAPLPLASPQRRRAVRRRLALQTRAPDAAAPARRARTGVDGDPGLLMDRANWLRDTNQSARRPPAAGPAAPACPAAGQCREMVRDPADSWRAAPPTTAMVDRLSDRVAARRRLSRRDRRQRPGPMASATIIPAWPGSPEPRRSASSAAPPTRRGCSNATRRAAKSAQTRTKGFYWAGARRGQRRPGGRSRNAYLEQAARPSGPVLRPARARAARPAGDSAPPPPRPIRSPAQRAAFMARAAGPGDPAARPDGPVERPVAVRPGPRRAGRDRQRPGARRASSAGRSAGRTSASGSRARRATRARASTTGPAFRK